MKGIHNIEQIEAHQRKLDEQNAKIYAKMPDSELKKIEAIKKALAVLTEAKVPVYIYAGLDFNSDGIMRSVQYNNLAAFVEDRASGIHTKNDKKFFHLMNSRTFASFVYSAATSGGMYKLTPENAQNAVKMIAHYFNVVYCGLKDEVLEKLENE